MVRKPLTHQRIFDDDTFTKNYARQHQKMAEKLGYKYAGKLASRGFKSGRILDAGCGFGGTDIILAEKFPQCTITGIDLSERLLDIANQLRDDAGLKESIQFELKDVQKTGYANNSFDGVLNINMVHIVEDPVQMLNEIERVLKPEGFLFITDLKRSWLGIIEREIKSAFTLQEAKSLFNRSQLRSGNFSSDWLWWRCEA